MTEISHTWIADTLNALPFVTWDRCVDTGEDTDRNRSISVFGWIDRNDGRKDFILVEFASWTNKPGFATSSAFRSREIAEILYGLGGEHFECERVEKTFAGLVVNVVRLEKTS